MEWKTIPIEPDYEISETGIIKRITPSKSTYTGKILKPFIVKRGTGYKIVNLRKKKYYVHRLVAITFLGPIPIGYEVDHIDGNSLNNNVINLKYSTHSENIKRAYNMGRLNAKGENNNNSVITNKQVIEIINLWKSGYNKLFISKKLNINFKTVEGIVKGERWTHITNGKVKRGKHKQITGNYKIQQPTVDDSEIWKKYKDYDYEVSNFGRVRRLTSGSGTHAGKILSLSMGKGYAQVGLSKNGKSKRFSVHTLVIESFIGSKPNGYQVHHLDNNPLNNNISNLIYVTHSQNMNYRRTKRTPQSSIIA